jgi:hypothetical protein
MKSTIVSILIQNSIEYLNNAYKANNDKKPELEVRSSIGAQLMIALAIEGIVNEIGEVALDNWQWTRIEKTDTPLKWYIISGLFGNKSFQPDKEPLQTIQKLHSIRNHIAHPKIIELGNEIIIRSKDEKLIRNIKSDYVLKDGDHILFGIGKLLDEFNFKLSYTLVKNAISAIKKLRSNLSVDGLEWVDEIEKELFKIKKTA